MRRNQTEAERTALYLLRSARLDTKFIRPCRIENWTLDLYAYRMGTG